MDKTHNISLGGMAFAIDDVAYRTLSKYLNDIRLSLHNSHGVEEIIADVEYRMAELLREKMMAREVVNQTDVDYLIGIMGKPEDFYNEDILDDDPASTTGYSSRNYSTGAKKLFRDPDDKILGGVCSGLAHYFGIDRTWMRLIILVLPFLDFVFLGISTTFVVLAYFVLWLVVPEAKTTSEKLQMRGEPVNFDSIKDFFGNSPDNVRNNLKDFGDDARRVANSSGSVIGNFLKIIFKIIGFIFLGFLLFIALILLFAFLASVLGLGTAFFGAGIAGLSLNEYFPYIFEGQWEEWVAFISLAFVMILPAIGLILLVLRLVSSRFRVPRAVAVALPFLWLMGLIGLAVVSVTTLRHFQKTTYDVKTVNIPTEAQTLVVQLEDESSSYDADDLFSIKPGFLALEKDDDIRVKKSETGNAYLELRYKAKGNTTDEAFKNLKPIDYKYQIKDSIIRLDEYIFLKEGSKWRRQQVDLTLYLPQGKNVVFKNLDVESYVDGNTNWHLEDSQKIYTFEGDMFKCVNCPEEIETVVTQEQDSVSAKSGVIKIKTEKDSIIIKTNQNGSTNFSISAGTDSISD